MSALPRGSIKQAPDDFVVDELPAYEPSGEGSHLYLRIEKRNVTTDDVVRAIARELRVDRRDIGVAGLKDKVGVTTQWLSVPANDAALEARVASLSLDGVTILEQRRHANKLKTGHLKGNRFSILVRDVDPSSRDEIVNALERIRREGVPNAFGSQRFGRDDDTDERARAWLTGKQRAPADPRKRRFEFSALQARIFNAVLDHRVRDGSWNVPMLGDVLKKDETGGIFVCTDVQTDRGRAARGEVCPTGPMIGDRMRQPEAEALELEQRIALPLIEGIDLHRARALGEGTRRPLCLRVSELSYSFVASSVDEADAQHSETLRCVISVRFVLPKGSYATTVLANAFTIADAARDGRELAATISEEE